MDIAAVERSFGELLAALGDVVVARSRGAPADRAGGHDARAGPPLRARRRRVRRRRSTRSPTPALRGEDARALANMRDIARLARRARSRRPGARPPSGGVDARHRTLRRAAGDASLDAMARRPRPCRSARRHSTADGPRAARHGTRSRTRGGPCSSRSGRLARRSTATAATRARTGALLRSSAARWRTHGSPIEANAAVARAAEPDRSRGRCTIDPGRLAVGRSGPDRIEPWDYWYAVGAAQRRLDRPCHASSGCSTLEPTLPGRRSARTRTRSGSLRRRAATRPAADPGGIHDRHGRLGRSAATGPWTRDRRGSSPRTRRAASGNLVELLHESGHAIHGAAIRTRPAFLEWTDRRHRVPRGHRRHPRLGRRPSPPGRRTGSARPPRRARRCSIGMAR